MVRKELPPYFKGQKGTILYGFNCAGDVVPHVLMPEINWEQKHFKKKEADLTMKHQISLGDKVKDTLTGFEGTAIGSCGYLSESTRDIKNSEPKREPCQFCGSQDVLYDDFGVTVCRPCYDAKPDVRKHLNEKADWDDFEMGRV